MKFIIAKTAAEGNEIAIAAEKIFMFHPFATSKESVGTKIVLSDGAFIIVDDRFDDIAKQLGVEENG